MVEAATVDVDADEMRKRKSRYTLSASSQLGFLQVSLAQTFPITQSLHLSLSWTSRKAHNEPAILLDKFILSLSIFLAHRKWSLLVESLIKSFLQEQQKHNKSGHCVARK